jgi:hypothetical protein
MRNSKRKGVAGYIEGVDRLRTRKLGTAYYSEDMEGLGSGQLCRPEAYGTRGLEAFIASGAWAGFMRCGTCAGWAAGCGDPGGCELLVISAGWIARGSGARAAPPARGQEARGRGSRAGAATG